MPSGPKAGNKFMNRHAAAANDRAAAAAASAAAAKAKADEEAYWAEDDDRATRKKLERAAERDAKAQEKAERKAENRELYVAETKKAKKEGPMEAFRRAQEELNREQAREREAAAAAAAAAASAPSRPPTVSNAETVAIMERASNPRSNARAASDNNNDGDDDDGGGDGPMSKKAQKAARRAELLQNIDNNAPTSDEFRRKAGKRAKVLYKQFQEQNMERIKSENPGMKRTQLLNVMWAEWQQNPQNPFLQRKEALNAEQQHAEKTWMEASDSDGDDG